MTSTGHHSDRAVPFDLISMKNYDLPRGNDSLKPCGILKRNILFETVRQKSPFHTGKAWLGTP